MFANFVQELLLFQANIIRAECVIRFGLVPLPRFHKCDRRNALHYTSFVYSEHIWFPKKVSDMWHFLVFQRISLFCHDRSLRFPKFIITSLQCSRDQYWVDHWNQKEKNRRLTNLKQGYSLPTPSPAKRECCGNTTLYETFDHFKTKSHRLSGM